MRSTFAALSVLISVCAWAQTTVSEVPLEPVPVASPDTQHPTADTATAPAPAASEVAAEGCRPLTDKAMAADLKALTAQAQKQDAAAILQLHMVSSVFWSKAVEQCDGRAKERAQRNLAEVQKATAALNEQLSNAPECGAAHKDAATLQDMARGALGERRWVDAASLFHKAEDMWDLAAERCTGSQKEIAEKRLAQAETDGFNAEFCAPLFDKAREHTQKLRASAAGISREEKNEGLMLAETLWRDALAQCKGNAAQDSARNNAQALARERGTPWVARGPSTASATALPANTAPAAPAKTTEAAAKPAVANAKTQAVAALNRDVSPAIPVAAPVAAAAVATSAPAAAAVIAASDTSKTEVHKPEPQPESFAVGDMQFKGQFVRDAGALTVSGNGQLTWANGDTYQGDLQSGKRHGKGLFVWANGQRYQGDWVHDVPTGQAIADFPNGNHYEGHVINGTPEGNGRMVYASGDTYSGQFKAGDPEGSGIYVWKNGQKFEGAWKGGRPNGQGKMLFASGDRYEGVVRDGMPDQKGSFTWANGDRYEGEWKAGLKEGRGTFSWANGDLWEGEYKNDAQTDNGALVRK